MRKDFGPYHRLTMRYHTDLLGLWGKARKKWLTDKAKINQLLKIIPRKFRIERLIFKKENQKGIQEAMEQAVKEGYWVALRSCYLYQPLGKAPWIMGVKSRRAIRLFFKKTPRKAKVKKPLWRGTPAHYDQWLKDPGLKEIIVMFNPQELSPQFAQKHFVARVEIFGRQLRLETKLYTDQLRDLEGSAERGELINLQMDLADTYTFRGGPLFASFGKKYLKKEVKEKNQKTLKMYNGQLGEFKIKNPAYARLVKPRALKITHQIAQRVFQDWVRAPLNLYYRLQALREFGLGILEIQGRMKRGKIVWMLAYELRGVREVSRIIEKLNNML